MVFKRWKYVFPLYRHPGFPHEHSQFNRLACLRLAERSANILHAVLQEVQEAGDEVVDSISRPIEKLVEYVSFLPPPRMYIQIHTDGRRALTRVGELLPNLAHQPFLKRYLKRDDTLREIENCDNMLRDALQMFSVRFQHAVCLACSFAAGCLQLSLQIRVLKQIQFDEERRREDMKDLRMAIEAQRAEFDFTDEQGDMTPTQTPPAHPETESSGVLPFLDSVQSSQNAVDLANDTAADLHAILPFLDDVQSTEKAFDVPDDTDSKLRATVQNAITQKSNVENKLDFANDTADLRAIIQRAITQDNDSDMLRILQVRTGCFFIQSLCRFPWLMIHVIAGSRGSARGGEDPAKDLAAPGRGSGRATGVHARGGPS